MAIQIDYFPADSDETAAATVNLEDGLRGQYEDHEPLPESTPTALSSDVDPGLGLGYLMGVLTGEDLDSYLEERSPEFIAASDDEQKFVLRVHDSVVERLAGPIADEASVITAWANVSAPDEADEWAPRERDLADFLKQFQTLAQTARQDGQSVYCWLWP